MKCLVYPSFSSIIVTRNVFDNLLNIKGLKDFAVKKWQLHREDDRWFVGFRFAGDQFFMIFDGNYYTIMFADEY